MLELLAFFKWGCETSEITMPWVQRLADAVPALRVRGIAQEDPDDAAALAAQLGLRVEVTADPEPYPLSREEGVHVVPTLVLLHAGRREAVLEGWNRQGFEDLVARVARLAGVPKPRVLEGDLPAFRPG